MCLRAVIVAGRSVLGCSPPQRFSAQGGEVGSVEGSTFWFGRGAGLPSEGPTICRS
jgi:hypothetical protein